MSMELYTGSPLKNVLMDMCMISIYICIDTYSK